MTIGPPTSGTGNAGGDALPSGGVRPRPGARRVRGVHEVRDAIRAAALLRPPMDAAQGRALLALLAPYRRRIVERGRPKVAPVLDGMPADGVAEAVVRYEAPVILDVLLPSCRRHLLDRLVGRGAEEDAEDTVAAASDGLPVTMEVAAAMRALSDALRGAGRLHLEDVVDAVARECRALVAPLARMTLDPDEAAAQPGLVGALSRTLMRLEALGMVIESAGLRHTATAEAAFQSRRSARLALRHAATVLRALLATDEQDILRLGLPEIAGVDSVIVVSLRILDALAAEEEERTHFVPLMDETALEEFVEAGTRLAHAILELLRRMLTEPDFDDAVFATMAGKLRWLHQFCARLGHEARPPALDELEALIVLQSTMLARRLSDALVDALPVRPGTQGAVRSLAARGDALAELVAGMNRRHVHAALTERLDAARQALGDHHA